MLKKLTDFRWINLWERSANNTSRIFASRKSDPDKNSGADAVVIIALRERDDKRYEELVVTKEYRHALSDYEWGFPAGLIENNENPVDAAKRELKEETGLDLTSVLYVSKPVYSSSGLSDESIVYVVCNCSGNISSKSECDDEDIETYLMSFEDIENLDRYGSGKVSARLTAFCLPILIESYAKRSANN